MLFKQKYINRILAGFLVTILCLSNIFTVTSFAVQTQFLGSNVALGSPLMSNTFTIEDWDEWEMLCFGIFLSNFCQPFEDDYYSAFTEGSSKGSNGKGLEALKFAAGGDATSGGYLTDMVNYCVESQAQSYKPIYVSYDYYEYDEKVSSDKATGAARQATFDDLIPILSYYQTEMEKTENLIPLFDNDSIKRPVVSYNMFSYTDATAGSNVLKSYVEYAVLPTFYAGTSADKSSVIFSLTDNWDIQILKTLIAKTFNKEASSNYTYSESESMMSSLETYFGNYLNKGIPLILDTYGNICINYGGRQVIVIPASTNQYLTKKTSYNYLNSLIMNNYVLSETESKIVVNSDEQEFIADTDGYLWWKDYYYSIGNFPLYHNDEIDDGKLLITNDTDTYMLKHFYEKMKDKNGKNTGIQYNISEEEGQGKAEFAFYHSDDRSKKEIFITELSDFNFSESIYNLLDEESFKNQALQIHITGVNSIVNEIDNKGWPLNSTDYRDSETESDLSTLYGAYGLLSTLFADDGQSGEILDYFYEYESTKTLEQAKTSIFDESYYLSPSLNGEKDNVKQLYSNYYFKSLNKKSLVLSSLDYDDDVRDKLVDNMKSHKNFMTTYYSTLTTENMDEELMNSGNTSLSDAIIDVMPANVIYKSFINRYFMPLKNDSVDGHLTSDLATIHNIDTHYNPESVTVDGYGIEGSYPSDFKMYDSLFSRLIKVYTPSSNFKALSSIFGLAEGCQFELYSTYIYVTYLDFYGLLSGGGNNFNEKIFDSGYFKSFTGENFSNGLTKEDMESQVKFNVYKLLSLNDDGAEYRKLLFESIIRTSIVEPLDKTMNSTGVGNVGSETAFLDVNSLEENVLIGEFIEHYWETISLVLFGVLSLIAVVSGALNNKTVSWYLTILVASSSLVYSIPFYLDIAPTIIEKYINSSFNVTGSYWALSESVELDKNQADLMSSTDEGSKAIAMLNNLNFLDTDSSLMIKLDISQKVLNKTAIDTDALQRLTTARWLLPSLMKQMSAVDGNYNYVSVPVTRLYDNFSKIWIMYHGESSVKSENPIYPDNEDKAERINLSDISPSSVWYGSGDRKYKDFNLDKLNKKEEISDYTGTISKLGLNNELTHTQFYIFNDNPIRSAYDTMGKDYLTLKDWKEYAEKVKNKDSLVNANYFEEASNQLLAQLNDFNQYQDSVIQEMGYLWTTENLGLYFYTLVKDTLGGNSAQNLSSLMTQLQGSSTKNSLGEYVRTSFMHYKDTGYERDVCDMEEVFTNLMPYMYNMMIVACGDSETSGVLGSQKMVGHPYYSDNYMSWLYRCNWITKIYEDNLYSGSSKTVSRDVDGNIIAEYEIPNVSDPRSYPKERPMVFSEAQMHKQNLLDTDLTYTELKILEFNSNVITRWTSLINYANISDLNKEHIYRQMAMDALFAFNETFTRDNIIMTEKTLYPQNYDLRSISLITILKSLVSNLTNNASYMSGNLADKLYTNNGFFNGFIPIFIIYWSFIFFGFIRESFTVIAFVSSIATLAFNFGSTSKNKFKAMGGWVITSSLFCALTMLYYFIVRFLIGNPRSDTLVNFTHISSTRLFNIPMIIWGLFILLLTLGFAYIIFRYFYELWIGHKFGLNIKDGGFSFYYQLADRATKSMVGATDRMRNKFGKTFGSLKNWGPGAEPIPVKPKSDPNKPQTVKIDKENKKSKNENELSGSDMNSNFNNGSATQGENAEVTASINESINKSKKAEAANENAKRVDVHSGDNLIINFNTTNNNESVVNNNTTNNVDNSNQNIASNIDKRIKEDSKKDSK